MVESLAIGSEDCNSLVRAKSSFNDWQLNQRGHEDWDFAEVEDSLLIIVQEAAVSSNRDNTSFFEFLHGNFDLLVDFRRQNTVLTDLKS